MRGRWATWPDDGASFFLVDIQRGRVCVRAFSAEDAITRARKHFGDYSNPRFHCEWAPRLPVQSASAPSATLDTDGVLWGMTEDRPLLSPAGEFRIAAGMEFNQALELELEEYRA